MVRSHDITVNGETFSGRRGELLLDAALNNGVELPFNCRAGHCGACCVRLVSGAVHGGQGAEQGVIHACQARIVGDAVVEKNQSSGMRTVEGMVCSLRPLSHEVMEVGIRTDRALIYHAGQYAQLRFAGYPSRPFSITHPVRGAPNSRTIWFHIRRMDNGRVTRMLGKQIKLGHKVKVTGPYGSAHFRPNQGGRLILVGTSTGFAPIWSIAIAALRENPERRMIVIAGGRTIESLYMGPALGRLSRFPNVRVVPCCSTVQTLNRHVKPGRPTDYLPRLHPSDTLYVCGAPEMVASVKAIAAHSGVVCYADPFLPTTDHSIEETMLTKAMGWLAAPTTAIQRIAIGNQQKRPLALEPPRKRLAIEAPRQRPDPRGQGYRMAAGGSRARSHYGA